MSRDCFGERSKNMFTLPRLAVPYGQICLPIGYLRACTQGWIIRRETESQRREWTSWKDFWCLRLRELLKLVNLNSPTLRWRWLTPSPPFRSTWKPYDPPKLFSPQNLWSKSWLRHLPSSQNHLGIHGILIDLMVHLLSISFDIPCCHGKAKRTAWNKRCALR